MSETNKALAKRWFEEVWNEGRRETIRELLAPEAVIQEGNDASVGPEVYLFFDRMQATFSEFHVTIHDAISEEDKVCVRWSCMVRHIGNGIGIPPTNKTLHTTGITVLRIAGGQFVAWWQNWDMLGLMQQIKDEPVAPTYIAAEVGKAGGA